MLLALKDDKLIKAIPRSHATCPHCGEDVISRCGSIRIWHWTHKVGECIYHTEPETHWHLEWKERALKLGLEIEKDVLGECVHIADIYDPKTNTVIELQHSPISEDEILDRCIYYSINDIDIRWIFDYTEKFKKKHIILTNYGILHMLQIIEQMTNPKNISELHLPDDLPIYVQYTESYFRKSLNCLYKHGYDVYYHLYTTTDNNPILLIKYEKYENSKDFIYLSEGKCIIYPFNEFKFNDDYLTHHLIQKNVLSFWSYMMIEADIEHNKYLDHVEEIEQLEEQKRRMQKIEDFQKIKKVYNIRCEKCGRNKDISATPFEIYDIVNNKRHDCGGNIVIWQG